MDKKTTTQQITWQTQAGKLATVSAWLDLSETVNLDGDIYERAICKLRCEIEIEGMGVVGTGEPQMLGAPVDQKGQHLVAKMGKVGLIAERVAQIEALIETVQQAPEWQKKIATEKANLAEVDEYEASQRRQPGWCPKCKSCCYGDCESN